MDQNKDGIIDKNDLKELYAQLGQIPSDSTLESMLSEFKGDLNFPTFLTLFGQRLSGSDPADTILGAFKLFDDKDTGFITETELLKILQNKQYGKPFSDEELKQMYDGKPPIKDGKVDYKDFVKLITTGAQSEMASEE